MISCCLATFYLHVPFLDQTIIDLIRCCLCSNAILSPPVKWLDLAIWWSDWWLGWWMLQSLKEKHWNQKNFLIPIQCRTNHGPHASLGSNWIPNEWKMLHQVSHRNNGILHKENQFINSFTSKIILHNYLGLLAYIGIFFLNWKEQNLNFLLTSFFID